MMHLQCPESSLPSLLFPFLPNSPVLVKKWSRDLVKIHKGSAEKLEQS